MKIQLLGWPLLLLLALTLSSCNKEYFETERISTEIELEPSLVAPLIYGSLSMKDIVERFDSSGFVGVFENTGLIYLSYRDTLAEGMADTLIDIPDQVFLELYQYPEIGVDPVFNGGNIGDTAHFFKSNQMSFRMQENDRIDSIDFKNGEIRLVVESNFRHTGYVVITSDQILDPTGRSIQLTVPISDDTGNFMDSISIPSDHFHLQPFNQGDSSVIQIDYHLALINSGNPVSAGESCYITNRLLDLGFYGVYGYIDSRDLITESGELDIPIFEDNPEFAALKLADPRISIFTASSIGVPFEIEMANVTATSQEGKVESLVFYEGHPFQIPGPDLEHIGETYLGEIHIDRETSNFPDLLNLAPSHITYDVRGRTKPGIPDQYHWLLDTSRFSLEAEVLVPLDLRITGLALSDTMDYINLEDFDTTMIHSVSVTIGTINELPFELGLQIYLMDDQYRVMDSLFVDESIILKASLVNQEGLLEEESTERHEVSIPLEKLLKIEGASYMNVIASVISSGEGEPYVKILEEYSLEYDISIAGKFRLNTEEL